MDSAKKKPCGDCPRISPRSESQNDVHATPESLKTLTPESETVRSPEVAVFSMARQWDDVLGIDVADGSTVQLGECDVAYFRAATDYDGKGARKGLRDAANYLRDNAIEFAIVLCSGHCPGKPDGGLFMVEDHVNWTGDNPLIGMRASEPGERFIDLAGAYDPQLRTILSEAARETGFPVTSGIGIEGSFGEATGFARFKSEARLSGVALPVIAARQAGARVAAVAWLDPAEGAFDGTPTGEKGYPIVGLRRFIQLSISSVVELSGV